jgi:ABC-type transport system substrate-binding protein
MLSSGPYTCCHDATLDGLINKTTQYGAPALRTKAFDAVYAYVAKNVLAVPLYTLKTVALATRNIQGFTAAPAADSTVISFQTLWMK